jgi:nucleoid DNA-binding protein
MLITREMMVKRLAKKSGYYEKDIRNVLQCLDDVVMECFGEVTDDEEISVQLTVGAKIGCKVVPPRERVNPKTQESIIVSETVKPFAKFSNSFRENIQTQYEEKQDG